MTPLPPSLYRIVTHGSTAGAVVINNTYHVYSIATVPTSQFVAEDFAGGVWPLLQPNLTNQYLLSSVTAERMLPDTSDVWTTPVNQTGSITLGPGTNTLRIAAPAVLAGVITWRTGSPGRSGRGRTYVAGMVCTHNDGVRWHAEQRTALLNIANAIGDHYPPAGHPQGLQLCVFSRKAGGRVPPFDNEGIQPVQAFTIQSYYATMGSRRLGHGI